MPYRRYPFERLPRLPSLALPTLRALRRHLAPGAPAALSRWAAECLGVESGQFTCELVAVAPSLDEALAPRLAAALRYEIVGDDGQSLILAADGALLSDLARRIARVPGGAGAPATSGERGLVAYALAWLLAALPSASSWVLRQSPPALDDLGGVVILSMRLGLGDGGGSFWLLVPSSSAALPASGSLPSGEARLTLATVEVSLPVELCRLRLPLAELGTLAAEDTLVHPSIPRGLVGAPAMVPVGPGGVRGALEGDDPQIESLRIDSWVAERPTTGDEKMPVDSAKLVEELEVEVVVELARVKVRAGDLAQLGAGDVLPLERPLVAPLTVRVGPQTVARAELVDVDGEAGLRILEVYGER